MTEFEHFLDYCTQDNRQLTNDIKTWLADYFDLPNRTIPLTNSEVSWITTNLSQEAQVEILGYSVEHFIKHKISNA
jgi:hypothetical protein